MMVDTADTALPSIGRVQVAFPETDLTLPTVMVRATFGVQREVGIGQWWARSDGNVERANQYDISVQFDVYGDDTLEVDRICDDLSDYIASNREGMQSWTDASDESPSMVDAIMVAQGDFGYIEETDAWRKTITYLVTCIKPH
jgi:hypothetical protein